MIIDHGATSTSASTSRRPEPTLRSWVRMMMIDRSSRQCIEHKPLEESQEEYEETSFACVQACVRHNPSREEGPFFPDSDVGNVAD